MKYAVQTLKQELIDLILKLSPEDYQAFCDNYSIKNEGRAILDFLQNFEEEEDVSEIIGEIHLNTETEY